MLDGLMTSIERKKVIPFKWTAEHRELLKDSYLENYFTIRKIIGANNEEHWPSDDAIRKQLNKWGFSRRSKSATAKHIPKRSVITNTPLIPLIESPTLANYPEGKKEPSQLLHEKKAQLFTCPEGYIGKTILTVGIDDCKWIYGEVRWGDISEIVYCGKESVPGQSYCKEHNLLCHQSQS